MITANNPYVVEDGSEKTFSSSTKLSAEPSYLPQREIFSVTIILLNSSTEAEEYRTVLDLTKTQVDAETGSGSGETDPWYKATQEAVITVLETYSANSGVTFTSSV